MSTTEETPVPVVSDAAPVEKVDDTPAPAAGEKTEEAAAPVKRPAEDAPAEESDAKKCAPPSLLAKADTAAEEKKEDEAAPPAPVEEEDEDVTADLAHLDQSNIIQGGRRTRGKKIDYSKLDGGDDEDDEDDEDAAPVEVHDEEGEGEEDDEEEDQESLSLDFRLTFLIRQKPFLSRRPSWWLLSSV
ncbi:hypothetical protein JCM1840_001133 [Sporobolomyces johnsonii]